MKVKNKKSLIAITAVLLIAVVGVTFAYFQSTVDFENLFTVGIYKVVTTETFESPTNWAPGEEIPKTITSTNEGTVPAAVRVRYTEQWLDDNNQDITSQVPNGTVIINLDNTSDWTQEGNYYYYNYILNPTETTSSFIKSVTLSDSINGMNCIPSADGLTQTCESNSIIQGATYKLTITKETVQADRYQEVWGTNVSITEQNNEPLPLVQIMNADRTKDTLQAGDEICINGKTTECFNFVRYDGNDIVMLSKWNLKVGEFEDVSTGVMTDVELYTSETPGYNLQSSDMRAAVANGLWKGVLRFSATEYWNSGNTLDSRYGDSWDTNDIYDTSYKTAPDYNGAEYNTPGYSLAYFVNNYKNILTGSGYNVNIKAARLLTYSEAVALGCSASTDMCPTNSFVANTTYWLGSAHDDNEVWFIDTGANFLQSDIYDYSSGVRPVIVISKSNI